MKSDHSSAPRSRRPVPEVNGNALGKGHADCEGSGSVGSGEVAAAGTSAGMPWGTPAKASGAAVAAAIARTRARAIAMTTEIRNDFVAIGVSVRIRLLQPFEPRRVAVVQLLYPQVVRGMPDAVRTGES